MRSSFPACMKKETRGRKPKKHAPVNASFEEVLHAVAKSNYRPKKKK
jgi:hypothetical protein